MKTKTRKWEMVVQGLVETRNALRRGNPLDAHKHLQFTITWADKYAKKHKNGVLVEPMSVTVSAFLDDLVRMIPRRPLAAASIDNPAFAAITTARRFIEREAKLRVVSAAQNRARDEELNHAEARRLVQRALRDAIERVLGRR